MVINMELAANELKLAQREGYNDFKVSIKTINTGSYLYAITGVYNIKKRVLIEVTKYRANKQLIGILIIDRYSNYGIEYDRTVIGTLPESVVKAIKQFINIYNKADGYTITEDRYFEIVFVDEMGAFSKFIKSKEKPTKDSLLKKYNSFMKKHDFKDIRQINEIGEEQYYHWKANII